MEGPKSCIFWLKIDWFYKIESQQIQMCIHRMNLGFKKNPKDYIFIIKKGSFSNYEFNLPYLHLLILTVHIGTADNKWT